MSETRNAGADPSADLEALRLRVAQLERELDRRRSVEEDLQKSEARYRMLVEKMNDGVGLQDERGNVVFINDRLAEMLGCTRIEVVGRPAIDFLDEAHRERFAQEMARPTVGTRAPHEAILRAKDGREVITLVSPAPVFGPDGTFRGSFAVFTDITAHKRAEEALAREHNLLRTLMDSIPDYTYVKDTQGRFVTTNIAHLRVLGVSSVAEVVGKTDFDFFPRELAEQYSASEQQVIASGQPLLNRVEQTVEPSGRFLWVMTFKAPLRDAAGNIVGIVGVSRDITPLRAAEHALRESEDRFRLILENTRDVAYKFDLATRRLEYVSPSALQWSGFTPEEVMAEGMPGFLRRIHPEDRLRVIEHARRLMAQAPGKEPYGVIEYRARHKTGQYRWIAHSRTIIRDEQGGPVAEVGTIRDITESRHAEDAVRAASRMEATATLAGGIAHDFNNLMVGVLGNAELLQLRFEDDREAMRLLTTIAQSAQQAGELAQQMLAFARGGKYEPRLMNLNDTIHEALRLEERSFPPRIRLEQSIAPGLWPIKADPVQMGQIIMNLSLNAVEAIEGVGRIRITTCNIEVDEPFAKLHPGLNVGCCVCLTVEDNGRGMSAEVKARVFEPFYTTKFQGRGLGLAAVYGIVKNHGGHVSVYSEEGTGTCFKVYLPAAEGQIERPPKMPDVVGKGTETILVIDDEKVVVNVTREILQGFGYRVLSATNGQEAVEIARAYPGPIHLALLDMGMPVMGGAQAYPLLTAARPGLKVIIASGYELDPAAQILLDAGATAFIHKPFRTQVLVSKIRNALDRGK